MQQDGGGRKVYRPVYTPGWKSSASSGVRKTKKPVSAPKPTAQQQPSRGSTNKADRDSGGALFPKHSALPFPEGNADAWRSLHSWLVSPHKRNLVCVVMGPSGVGKTMGAHVAAKRVGREVVELEGGEILSAETLWSDLAEACTRKGLDGVSPFLLLDDIDALPEEAARSLVKFATSPPPGCNGVVCTCGPSFPTRLRDLKETAFVLRLSPLSVEELVSVTRRAENAAFFRPFSTQHRQVLAQRARGDARQLFFAARMRSAREKDETVDPFSAARRILYQPRKVAEEKGADYLFSVGPEWLMLSLLFTNHTSLDSSFDHLVYRADVVSHCDTCRQGNVRSMLGECASRLSGIANGLPQRKYPPSLELEARRASFPKKSLDTFSCLE